VEPDRLLKSLLEAQLDFVIIGGVAAVLHGSTLLTRDLDICVPLGSGSFLALQKALEGLHPRVRAGAGLIPLDLDESRAASLKNLYITTDEGQLDCLGLVAGVGDFAAVRQESLEIRISGHQCRVLSIDALIRAKKATGRPHDLRTVVQLKAIKERGNVVPPAGDPDDSRS
jgi:hypothetical protein